VLGALLAFRSPPAAASQPAALKKRRIFMERC
jgi:hypothetical protein